MHIGNSQGLNSMCNSHSKNPSLKPTKRMASIGYLFGLVKMDDCDIYKTFIWEGYTILDSRRNAYYLISI